MPKYLVLIVLAIGLATGAVCAAGAAGPDLNAALATVAKSQALKSADTPQLFGPNNLADFVDGAADAYLKMGFRQAISGEYAFADLAAKGFTIDIYLMNAPTGAQAAFQKEAGAPTAALKLGEKARRNANSVLFLRGRFFVKITAFSSDATLMDRLVKLGGALDLDLKKR